METEKQREQGVARKVETLQRKTRGEVLWESASLLAGVFSARQAHKGPERSVGCFVVRVEEPAAAPSTHPFTPQRSCCSRTTADVWRRSCECADGLTGGRGRVAGPPSSEEQVGSPATTTHAAMQTQEAAARGIDVTWLTNCLYWVRGCVFWWPFSSSVNVSRRIGGHGPSWKSTLKHCQQVLAQSNIQEVTVTH